jgi:hypothetical protein
MTPHPPAPGAFVLVIGRNVYRGVPAVDLDAVREAMAAGVESVSFTSAGQVVRARITGVEVGWAPERPTPAGQEAAYGTGETACPSCTSTPPSGAARRSR